MQNVKSKITLTMVSLAALSSLMAACTKEVPYKSVYKGAGTDQVQEKSIIDTNAEYIYVGSSDLANQDSTGASNALPYWQGEEKIVKFRFTEQSLQVLQIHEETRLKDNKTNDKILFEIPVNHVAYRCATDRYDKCTNREEENNEAAWNQKTKFVPKFDNLRSTSFSLLPVEMDKVFGSSCFEETASQLLGYDLTDSALNVQIQKTFKANLKCIEEKGIAITSLEDMQSQIIYHYSFTKLNTLVSPNYKIVKYPVDDEGLFGFFTTRNRKYDVDFSRTPEMKTQYMNRWNPEKKEIVYYLTDNFNKPELKPIKDATYKAFERVNNGLKAAGMETRLVLKEPDHKVPGDVRNSMIVLVEDPVAGGPLGYGPTVANPRTGEIMSGRVAMYYGNYLQNVRYSYDEVVRELRREKKEAQYAATDAAEAAAKASAPPAEGALKLSPSLRAQTKLAAAMSAMTSKQQKNSSAKQINKPGNNFINDGKFSRNALAGMNTKSFAKAMLQTNKQNTARDAISAMSKYCNYPAELFPFNEIVKNALQSKLGEELKLWNDLTTDERKIVLDIIMPEVWLPTLVHELGHNLGLRHNFGASEDKDNFYTKDELHAMGVTHEIPYSSVMDYGYSELNLLPTLGKYDIAALRFGYKRELDTTEGQTLNVKTTVGELKTEMMKSNTAVKFKDYSYCSDEHVEVNPNCKRFDRGTNMTEIVSFLIKSYNNLYTTRNFRNGRESFSKYQDGAYYRGTMSRFAYIRAFMERYESIKYRFSMSDSDPEWESVPFLKDLKQAVLLSGEFIIKVLQTPEPTCAIAEKEHPTTVVTTSRLAAINPNAMTCFDVKLKPEYVMVGEGGKAFNDLKDPQSDNHYADQIDVRGFWPDKLAAARTLLQRRVGNSSYDQHEDNYADIAELAPKVKDSIVDMMFNQAVTEVTFHDAQGLDILTINLPMQGFSSPSDLKTEAPLHWIDTPIDESVATAVGIPMQQTSLMQVLMNIVSGSMSDSQSHKLDSDDFLSNLSIIKTSRAYQLDSTFKGNIKDVGATRYVALENHAVANKAMALGMISSLLNKLDDKQLSTLVAEKTAEERGKAPATSALPPEYKPIPLLFVQIYQQGLFPSEEMMDYLLGILPN